MVKTTKAQRMALKRIYDRRPIFPYRTDEEIAAGIKAVPITYKQFRRGLQAGYDCVMIQWAGMWVGIEPDGYAHT